jgi:hypothetical protein
MHRWQCGSKRLIERFSETIHAAADALVAADLLELVAVPA